LLISGNNMSDLQREIKGNLKIMGTPGRCANRRIELTTNRHLRGQEHIQCLPYGN
jgi:hypothetical protein